MRTHIELFAALGAIAALAACNRPVSGVPTAQILEFKADPAAVKAGARMTLSWRTANAVELTVRDGEAVLFTETAADQLASGSRQVTITRATTFVLQARSTSGTATAEAAVSVLAGARIVRLELAETPISPGRTTTLSWQTEGAESVALTADSGQGPAALDLTGKNPAADSLTLSPTQTTTYTLTATSGFGDDSRSVRLEVLTGPAVTAFSIAPSHVLLGQSATLSWTTASADSVAIRDGTSELDLLGKAPNDTLVVTPTTAGVHVYTLTATGPGDSVDSAPVQLNVADGPAVIDFSADRTELGVGDSLVLSWTTVGATAVGLRDGEATVFMTGKNPAADSVTLTNLAAGSHRFVLTAIAAEGSVDSTPVVVEVYPLPRVVSFAADRARAAFGMPVRLSWTTQSARSIQLTDGADEIALPGKSAEADSIDLRPAVGTHRFQLLAVNPAGVAPSAVVEVVVDAAPPVFSSFTVTPPAINVGETATLAWSATNATDVYLVPYQDRGAMSHGTGEAFEDISASGTRVPGMTADDQNTVVAFPGDFSFPFFEIQARQAVVSTNGWIGFDDPASYYSTYMFPDRIPNSLTPNALLAVLWDDLAPKANGKLFTELRGTAPTRRFIIQYTDYSYSVGLASQLTFQAVLFETGEIELRYKTISGGDSTHSNGGNACIGLENSAGSWGYQVAYKVPNAVQSGSSIRFQQRIGGAAGTFTVSPTVGTYPFTLAASGPGGRGVSATKPLIVAPASAIATFTADRLQVGAGNPIKLSWVTSGAVSWTLDLGGTPVPAVPQQGSVTDFAFAPTGSGALTLHATNAAGKQATASLPIVVGAPVIADFTVDKAGPLPTGETISLRWQTKGATTLTLTSDTGAVLANLLDPADRATIASGTRSHAVEAGSHVYTLTVTNGSGSVSRTIAVTGTSAVAVASFTATPSPVSAGEPLSLRFSAINATQVTVTVLGASPQPPGFPYTATANLRAGEVTTTALSADTTYQLVAEGPGGPVTKQLVVPVLPRPQVLTLTATPASGNPGDAITLAWTAKDASSLTLRTSTGQTLATGLPPSGTRVVNPVQPTTYVPWAVNSLGLEVPGTSVTVAIAVTGPTLTASASPTKIAKTGSSTISWASTGVDAVTVSPIIVERKNLQFIDIGATGIRLSPVDKDGLPNFDEGKALITLPANFRFPYFGKTYGAVWATTNGWLGLEPTYSGAAPINFEFPTTAAPKSIIAPFWDDLKGTNLTAAMLYEVRGTAPNRKLIVQWSNWSTYALSGNTTLLTFEAILHENGDIEFQYQTLDGLGSDARLATGSSATIGCQDDGASVANIKYVSYGFNTVGQVTSGDGLLLHTAPLPLSASLRVSPTASTTYLFTGTSPTGSITAPVRIEVPVSPGDILITELLVDPVGDDGQKQWIELRNLTTAAIDLRGFELSASGGAHTIAAASPVLLPASGYAVLAQSSSPAENGGLSNVLYAYRDAGLPTAAFAMSHIADTVALKLAGTTISAVPYDTSAGWTVLEGHALQLDGTTKSPAMTDRTFWCSNPAAGVDVGTPGAANVGCYRWTGTPAAFQSVASLPGATTQLTSTFVYKNGVALPFAFPYFGRTYSAINLTSNGLATFDPLSDSQSTNRQLPSSYGATDLIAPYWTTLSTRGGLSAGVVTATRGTAPNRQFAIEWMNYYPLSGNYSGDAAPVQLLLGEDGSIEFQYGALAGAKSFGQDQSVGLQVQGGAFFLSYTYNGSPNRLTANTGLKLAKLP